jgi:two-component system, NtrC family, response regulator
MAKILIIDDDVVFCSMLTAAMEVDGNEVHSAYTIEEGLRLATLDVFDVVFLDVVLPDGNGLDRLSEIHSVSSEPEVIILTGGGTPNGAELAIGSGAWDYIQKPFSLSVIKLHLMRALQYREERRMKKPAKTLKIDAIIGNSSRMKIAYDLLSEATTTDVNVLITGETGTGKELFAKAIHDNSRRAGESFVVVDCAAIQGTLIESILFGHEKGAFTGAVQSREGLIQQADGGTLFLDEVAELPLSLQKVFLRVLQERRFRPVGGRKEVASDFRLIAATNRDLESMIKSGQFREDLFYRLRAHTIALPSLRDHREDIVPIAVYHTERIYKRSGLNPKTFSPDFIEALLSCYWPGNVRELVNAIESAVAAASSASTLFKVHLPREMRVQLAQSSVCVDTAGANSDCGSSRNFQNLKDLREATYSDVERKYLQNLIKHTEGDIALASELCALSQRRLYELLKKHRIPTKD